MTNLPLIVMYHYVWPDDEPAPGGIRPLLTSEFERQLDWLGARHEIVPPDRFLELLSHGSWVERSPCLLTFDDGTRDHAEVVTPILKRRGLGGLFFVLTWPIDLKRMPMTHAVHWLLGQDEGRMWREFEREAIRETAGIEILGDPVEAKRIYHYESPARARIKYAANMMLPSAMAERVIERIIATTGRSSEDLAAEWFVSSNQILAMREAGMTIGLHGCSHRSLQSLGAQGIGEEVSHCSQYISRLLGERPEWFACPFGGSGASLEAVEAMRHAMRACRIRGSVTTEKLFVPRDCDPWRLPRMDAIDLPPRTELSPPIRSVA
jgi:peptidoglycan/xylan/chitin deacetylase (PgdA/CDA1 family)